MPTRVLMVCLGNICRSPLAQGILENMVDSSRVTVDSAGTAGYHVGSRPDERSILVARKHGIDIAQQKCRKFSPSDFDYFDVIYAMDKSNYGHITALAQTKEDLKKVKLLLHEIDSQVEEVPDPYYGSGDGFEKVYHLIHEACLAIAGNLNSKT